MNKIEPVPIFSDEISSRIDKICAEIEETYEGYKQQFRKNKLEYTHRIAEINQELGAIGEEILITQAMEDITKCDLLNKKKENLLSELSVIKSKLVSLDNIKLYKISCDKVELLRELAEPIHKEVDEWKEIYDIYIKEQERLLELIQENIKTAYFQCSQKIFSHIESSDKRIRTMLENVLDLEVTGKEKRNLVWEIVQKIGIYSNPNYSQTIDYSSPLKEQIIELCKQYN